MPISDVIHTMFSLYGFSLLKFNNFLPINAILGIIDEWIIDIELKNNTKYFYYNNYNI